MGGITTIRGQVAAILAGPRIEVAGAVTREKQIESELANLRAAVTELQAVAVLLAEKLDGFDARSR